MTFGGYTPVLIISVNQNLTRDLRGKTYYKKYCGTRLQPISELTAQIPILTHIQDLMCPPLGMLCLRSVRNLQKSHMPFLLQMVRSQPLNIPLQIIRYNSGKYNAFIYCGHHHPSWCLQYCFFAWIRMSFDQINYHNLLNECFSFSVFFRSMSLDTFLEEHSFIMSTVKERAWVTIWGNLVITTWNVGLQKQSNIIWQSE